MKVRFAVRALTWLAVAACLTVPAESREYADAISQGDALRIGAEYRRALSAYVLAAALRPKLALPAVRAAETCLAWGRPASAVDWYRKAQRREPTNLAILVGWGQAYADLGDDQRAAGFWQTALRSVEAGAAAHYRLGLLNLEQADFAAASPHLEAALLGSIADSEAQAAHYWLGLLGGLKDPVAAVPDLRLAAAGPEALVAEESQAILDTLAQATSRSSKAAVGAALVGMQRWLLAGSYLQRALAENPDDVAALAYLGASLDGQSQRAAADACLRSALARQPDSILGLFLWGRHLALQAQTRAARYVFERLLALDPTNAAACAEIGRTYVAEHEYAQAESWFEAAIARAPAQAGFYLTLAEFEGNSLFNVSKGLAAAKMAVGVRPDHARAQDVLGWAQYLSGKWVDAETALRQAVRLEPAWATPYYHLGRLYDAQGRIESARWAFGRVLDLGRTDPVVTEAEDALQRLGPGADDLLDFTPGGTTWTQ